MKLIRVDRHIVPLDFWIKFNRIGSVHRVGEDSQGFKKGEPFKVVHVYEDYMLGRSLCWWEMLWEKLRECE